MLKPATSVSELLERVEELVAPISVLQSDESSSAEGLPGARASWSIGAVQPSFLDAGMSLVGIDTSTLR